jgi:lysophospholipase L1-like esterase
MDAQGSAISDPVAFKLKPSARIAITIYYGQCKSSTDMTFHYGSRTNSYFLTGNKLSSADFAGSTTIQRWYTISGIDVIAPTYAGSVVCFGNSITDGYGLSDSPNQPGLQNRWTDIFSERLLANPSTAQVGVLNEGIGATTVLSEGNGAKAGTVRFAPDVLDQAGVRWIIILYGVNDIHGGKSGDQVINDGYKKLIAAAHAKSKEIKVYGGTLTPMGGDAAYASNESARTTINNWIRTAGNFDGVIDFDKAVRDPSNLTSMRSGLANGLHPSVAGYKAMGDSIDLKMFAGPVPVNTAKEVKIQGYSLGDIKSNPVNGNTMVSFEIPNESFVSLKVFSMLGKEVAELGGKNFSTGKHIVQFESKNLPKEMYLFSIKAGAFSDSRKMILPIR